EKGLERRKRRRCQHQGVAIGRGTRNRDRADYRVAARPVFNNYWLFPDGGKMICKNPCNGAGSTAGWQRHDQMHRPRRKIKCRCKLWARESGASGPDEVQEMMR